MKINSRGIFSSVLDKICSRFYSSDQILAWFSFFSPIPLSRFVWLWKGNRFFLFKLFNLWWTTPREYFLKRVAPVPCFLVSYLMINSANFISKFVWQCFHCFCNDSVAFGTRLVISCFVLEKTRLMTSSIPSLSFGKFLTSARIWRKLRSQFIHWHWDESRDSIACCTDGAWLLLWLRKLSRQGHKANLEYELAIAELAQQRRDASFGDGG